MGMQDLIELQPADSVWALGMMAIAIGLSAWQRLGLEWSLVKGTTLTVANLAIVGYVLTAIFQLNQPWAVLAVLAVMLTIAATVSRNSISKNHPKLLPLVWGSILVSTALTLSYTIVFVIHPQTWYEPQYLIPLFAVVLGNAMNGAAIAGERLINTINASRLEIETHLSLGATPQQAVTQYRKDAIRAGLIPTLNQMMVVGVVTLPPFFAGQLLSNIKPLNAASYQILIMFMLVSTNLVTTLLVTQGLCRQFFNQTAQLKIK